MRSEWLPSTMFSVTKTHKAYSRKRQGGPDHQLHDLEYVITDTMKLTFTMTVA